MHLCARLWHDDTGALIATEYVFVATLLGLGTVSGLVGLRNAGNAVLTDCAADEQRLLREMRPERKAGREEFQGKERQPIVEQQRFHD